EVAEELPALLTAKIVELRGGLPTMTPDGHFIVDRLPSVDGCYVITGCHVGGLSTSPALGHDLAAWIVTGERPVDLGSVGLARSPSRSSTATCATFGWEIGNWFAVCTSPSGTSTGTPSPGGSRTYRSMSATTPSPSSSREPMGRVRSSSDAMP